MSEATNVVPSHSLTKRMGRSIVEIAEFRTDFAVGVRAASDPLARAVRKAKHEASVTQYRDEILAEYGISAEEAEALLAS